MEVAGVEGDPFSPVPEIFDMSELDDWDVFGSGGSQVMMVEAVPVAENVCSKLGLSSRGGKNKVLRRLKLHYEVLEKQLTNEVAKKMFAEQQRDPRNAKDPASTFSQTARASQRDTPSFSVLV